MSDSQNNLPKTTQLAAVPEWAAELTRATKEGFSRISANLELVSTDLSVVKDRVNILESRQNEFDTRASRSSEGVRGLSQADHSHDAQLVQERSAREALAKKTDSIASEVTSLKATNETQLAILSRLDRVASNPLVKTMAAMLATALITWLASKGIRIQ